MKCCAYALTAIPLVAEQQAGIDQEKAPRPRSEESVEVETAFRHARNAGWERDKRSHQWQHACDQHGQIAEPIEKPVRSAQILVGQQDIVRTNGERDRAAWGDILGSPTLYDRPLNVTVGIEGNPPLALENGGAAPLTLTTLTWPPILGAGACFFARIFGLGSGHAGELWFRVTEHVGVGGADRAPPTPGGAAE
jgi:hypothetical protein